MRIAHVQCIVYCIEYFGIYYRFRSHLSLSPSPTLTCSIRTKIIEIVYGQSRAKLQRTLRIVFFFFMREINGTGIQTAIKYIEKVNNLRTTIIILLCTRLTLNALSLQHCRPNNRLCHYSATFVFKLKASKPF